MFFNHSTTILLLPPPAMILRTPYPQIKSQHFLLQIKAPFVGYLVIHPRVPVISVTDARLDLLRNDLAGLLRNAGHHCRGAQNGNAKAHSTFSDFRFNLTYLNQDIAMLVADRFEVPKNSTKDLNYVVQSSSIPWTPDQMEQVNEAWKRNDSIDVVDFGGEEEEP